ncbi:DUF86 domain-containing protein [Candidatus Palauibacter sp.]|uniref:HepT-like ribonuclease domain-containing protein n=1 Tax=Candidatus Palauibacter sp. TaxID=3101350 RepID=UPI003CC69BEA
MRDDDAYLLDMLLAARDAEEFASDLTFEKFEHDKLHQHAIIKAIEIIGEAANRVSAETRDLHSEIPWLEIVGMRNRLVHAYFEVDVELLWETVQRDIPDLISLIEPLVPPEEA